MVRLSFAQSDDLLDALSKLLQSDSGAIPGQDHPLQFLELNLVGTRLYTKADYPFFISARGIPFLSSYLAPVDDELVVDIDLGVTSFRCRWPITK